MSVKYTYIKAVHAGKLMVEIENAGLSTALEYIVTNENNVDIWMADTLSGPDESTLNQTVTNHDNTPPAATIDTLTPFDVNINYQPAFAAKTVGAKGLFNRTTGKTFSLSAGANTCEFAITYPQVKFNGITILNGELGDSVNLKILDDALGTYSTIPDYQLNQFGFTVNVKPDFYYKESRYDADIYQGMRIVIEYDSVSAKTLYVNYDIHEVK